MRALSPLGRTILGPDGHPRMIPPDYLERRRILRRARAGSPGAVAALWRKYRVRMVNYGKEKL